MAMRLNTLFKALAPVAAIALAGGISGCHGKVSINGSEGVPLSELDLSGKAPDQLVLAGPDEVRVTRGDKLAITVDGDSEAAGHVRFTLKDGALGILRESGLKWRDGDKTVVVNVTMPDPRQITLAGSGRIATPGLAKDAEVTVAGSGSVDAGSMQADRLKLTIAGSGDFRGAGTARDLNLTIAGSGSAHAEALRVDNAKVTVAGSGNAAFASDGNVKADILGSGEVRVRGRATCKVSSMGSGKLVCEAGDAPPASPPPAPPTPPSAPTT
jgi:hypothetical protein